jgi:small subunit ribosomal protein S8
METVIKSLNQVVNGQKIGANAIVCSHSKTLEQVLNILTDEGFIRGFFKEKVGYCEKCYILLKYVDDKPAIKNIVFSSRPGFKSFIKWKDLSKSINGVGIWVMSTNKGVITNEEAFYKKVGGQCLFKIY